MNSDDLTESLGRFAVWLIAAPVMLPIRFWRWWRTRRNTPEPPELDWEREREARERRQKEEMAKIEAPRRRADARGRVELEYVRLSALLGDFFTREMLGDYLKTYMNEQCGVEDVERRGKELIAMLDEYVREKQQEEEQVSFDQLDAWYQAEQERIKASSGEDRLKRRLLAALNVRYDELASKLMEELEP